MKGPDNPIDSELQIRGSRAEDAAAIESLYQAAFPDEDLLPLVHDLLNAPGIALSLVATIDSQVAGHAMFTRCGVKGTGISAALLGPVAVAPAWQRQGTGSAIVRAGLELLRGAGVTLVCVLGDPAYYGRLGFIPESTVEPPYALPTEWEGAWQSQSLGETRPAGGGKLALPRQWLEPSLWSP
jgi:putative acetyltransferase